jgi:hypothetical protein
MPSLPAADAFYLSGLFRNARGVMDIDRSSLANCYTKVSSVWHSSMIECSPELWHLRAIHHKDKNRPFRSLPIPGSPGLSILE